MPVYLGERYIRAADPEFARQQSDAIRAAVRDSPGSSVRLLSTTSVANEEWVFDLFEAESPDQVKQTHALGAVAFERVSEAIHLPADYRGQKAGAPAGGLQEQCIRPTSASLQPDPWSPNPTLRGVGAMNARQIVTVGTIAAIGIAAGIGLSYSLGISNTGIAGSYRGETQSFPMTFTGEYQDGAAYTAGDVVTYDGSAYIASGEASWAPPEVPWRLLVAAGPIGPAGPQGDRGPTGAQGPKGDKGDPGTAASWIPVASQPSVITNGTLGSGQARCPSSAYLAIGGGWVQIQESGFRSDNNLVLTGNGTIASVSNVYDVLLRNLGPGDAKIKVFAICVPW